MAMKCDIKAMGLSFGILWSLLILFVGWIGMLWPGYGSAFVASIGSIYPGYQATFVGAIVGGILALLDGAFAGAFFAYIYNYFAKK